MKHKNKMQIAGLGLALALSQAVSAYAAGTVVVGKAPGETAAETTAAEATTKAAPENTTTATTKAAPAVLDTPAHVVTAGRPCASNSQTPAPQPSTAAADSTQSTASAAAISQPEVAGRGRCTVKRGNR